MQVFDLEHGLRTIHPPPHPQPRLPVYPTLHPGHITPRSTVPGRTTARSSAADPTALGRTTPSSPSDRATTARATRRTALRRGTTAATAPGHGAAGLGVMGGAAPGRAAAGRGGFGGGWVLVGLWVSHRRPPGVAGSRASRRPSPTRLTLSTISTSSPAAKQNSQGNVVAAPALSAITVPSELSGGCTPNPK